MTRQVPATKAIICFWFALACAIRCNASCTDPQAAQAAIVDSPTLTVATLNIAHGRNDSFNQMLLGRKKIEKNLLEVAAQLNASNADAVAIQEADAPSLWSGQFDHVAFLASKAGLPCYFHGLHDESTLSNYGTAILARYPLAGSVSHSFAPSWPTKPKGFVLSRLAWNPDNALTSPLNLALVSVHLDFSRDSVRQQQIGEMIELLSQIDAPLVIMGDFNAEWAAQSSAIRVLADKLQLHAFAPGSPGFDTYPSQRKRLDWILLSKQLSFLRHEVLAEAVSDHLAVVAEIGVEMPVDTAAEAGAARSVKKAPPAPQENSQ